ncbi:MAG: hypothetical protein NZT92_17710, partial [Abditibacteriales bacterium]|nr:hypothetical protein [Abditibacteriales bacterium]
MIVILTAVVTAVSGPMIYLTVGSIYNLARHPDSEISQIMRSGGIEGIPFMMILAIALSIYLSIQTLPFGIA